MISRRHASRGGRKRFCRTTYACMRVGTWPTGGRSPRSYRSAMSPLLSSGVLAVELFDESGQARVVEPGFQRLVERRAVEETRVAFLELPPDRRVRSGDGERLDHLVADHVGHAQPVPHDGLPAKRGDQALPPMG